MIPSVVSFDYYPILEDLKTIKREQNDVINVNFPMRL